MKLVLKDGAFVLLPQSSADARLLAELIDGTVKVSRSLPAEAYGAMAEALTTEGLRQWSYGDGRVAIASTGQLAAKSA